MMMMLIAVLDILEDLQRLLVGGGLHLHLLETTFQGTVFLDRVTVFVECRGTDALDGTSGQSGFHDVSCIHRSRC